MTPSKNSPTQEFDFDVVVIGYGPSGVTAANALGQRGVSTLVIERNPDIYSRARAVTVSDWTMRIFQSFGLTEEVLEHMDPSSALRWLTYEGDELLQIPFSDGEFGYRTSYAIYQPGLEQALRDGANRFDSIELRMGVELVSVDQDNDGVTIHIRDLTTGEESSCRAKYALACHGGERITREILGVELEGNTEEQRWIIIDGKVKQWWPNRHILTFWSDREKPMVDIALGRDNHRWEILLGPGETDGDFVDNEDVWPLLEAAGVSREDVDIHGFAFYSHHVRMAKQWRMGRVFLVGDAAHLMPPWAGAGMQSAIRDATNISWKLSAVLSGALPQEALDTYQAERAPNVDFYTQVSIQLGRIIKQELTEDELAAMAQEPESGPDLLRPPSYPDGWFTGLVIDDNGLPQTAVGQMIPQPRAANTQGLITMLDELLGNGFVLLGDNVLPETVLSPEEKAQWDGLNASYRAVRPVDQRSEDSRDIIDIDGDLLDWMRQRSAKVIAVRPDKFVAAADSTGLVRP